MFLFYIFVSPLFRFGPNFRAQNEDIDFGLGKFPTVEKVFCLGVHRAPTSLIDSRVNGKIVQTVEYFMCNVSCLASGNLATLLLQGAQLATAGKLPRFVHVGKGTDQAQQYKKTNDMQNKI